LRETRLEGGNTSERRALNQALEPGKKNRVNNPGLSNTIADLLKEKG
jgi:hypothetical protein